MSKLQCTTLLLNCTWIVATFAEARHSAEQRPIARHFVLQHAESFCCRREKRAGLRLGVQTEGLSSETRTLDDGSD